jgi:hypothetical protein
MKSVMSIDLRTQRRKEVELYQPVKRYLEGLGYSVKGEIGGCDLVGLREDDRVVIIGELKLSFNLELVLQAVDRLPSADEVWLAVPMNGTRERDGRVRKLCRLLGFGLLAISSQGKVELLVSPELYRPRPNLKRRSSLVSEHKRRRGDPVPGGGTRMPIMTAYRQQALTCAAALSETPSRPRDLKQYSPDAQKILLHNVYGWFERVERGVYTLTEAGRAALIRWGPPSEVIPPVAPR